MSENMYIIGTHLIFKLICSGKLASYLGRVIKRPRDQSKLWATGNYLLDAADSSRDMGFMMQSFIIANEQTGLPDIFYFSLITHNAGLVVQDYAVIFNFQQWNFMEFVQ